MRAVPRLDRTAYLYAKLTLAKGGSPVLPGKASLNRDGVFVGWGRFPQLAPGEDFELGFGADDRVKVKRAAVEDKTGEAGRSKSSHFENRTYTIFVKNLHARPIEVQVLDRAPVSMHKDIKVEFTVTKGPQPTKKDVNDRRGVFMWQLMADPDQEQQFGFNYKVTAPADKPIRYGDLTEDLWQKGQIFRFGAIDEVLTRKRAAPWGRPSSFLNRLSAWKAYIMSSMPPMPPMPPPMRPPPPADSFFGASATPASVVISRPAMEAAS